METGKTGKYFKYAIGEIALVMIGILLALQVNNWNENRKLQTQELNLAQQLLDDVKADSVFFESRISFQKGRDSVFTNVLYLYNQIKVDSISNLKLTYDPFFNRMAYQSNLINNNPDAYKNISDEPIKSKLRDYAAKYDYVVHAVELSNRVNEEYGVPLKIKYFNEIQALAQVETPLMKDLQFIIADEEAMAKFDLFKTYGFNYFVQIEKFLEVNQELKILLEAYIQDNK